jgi:hypothetical protein
MTATRNGCARTLHIFSRPDFLVRFAPVLLRKPKQNLAIGVEQTSYGVDRLDGPPGAARVQQSAVAATFIAGRTRIPTLRLGVERC